MQSRVLIATSNPGKLRDFAGAAAPFGVSIANIPNFSSLTPVVEDGTSFDENARKKAAAYSLAVPRELVLADDSGLEIDALGGAPGVHSARYAADDPSAAANFWPIDASCWQFLLAKFGTLMPPVLLLDVVAVVATLVVVAALVVAALVVAVVVDGELVADDFLPPHPTVASTSSDTSAARTILPFM